MQVSKTYLAERGEEAKWSHVTLISRVESTFEGSNLSGKVSEQKEGDSERSSSCKKLRRQSSTTTTTSLKLPRTSKLEHLASLFLRSPPSPSSLSLRSTREGGKKLSSNKVGRGSEGGGGGAGLPVRRFGSCTQTRTAASLSIHTSLAGEGRSEH